MNADTELAFRITSTNFASASAACSFAFALSAANATSTASMIDWISSTVAAENASAIAVLYPSIFPFTTPSSSAAVLAISTR